MGAIALERPGQGSAQSRLAQVAAELSRVDRSQVEALCNVMLAVPSVDRSAELACGSGRSGLNDDGSPLQYCLTSTRQGWRSRLLADPAWVLAEPLARFEQSRQALIQVLGMTQSEALLPLCDRTLTCYLPSYPAVEAAHLAPFDSGVMWLGAGVDTPGAALYLDGRCGGQSTLAWQQAADWLATLLPQTAAAEAAIASLSRYGELNSVGIEGTKPENARAKLYWRLKKPVLLEEMGLDLLQNPIFASFLSTAAQDRRIQLSGLVFSAGFLISTGELFDLKIDLCGHCLNYPPKGWQRILGQLTQTYELTPLPVAKPLNQGRCQVSYLGFGLDRQGSPRLNLYLKAPSSLGSGSLGSGNPS